jgi:hypothetical protein
MSRRSNAVLAVVAAFGCDAPEQDAGDEDEMMEVGCAAETRADDYALGLEKSGATVRVQFVDAVPAPPDRGDNTWVVRVLDLASGQPVDDALLDVEPYMPDHNHGSSIATGVTPTGEPGELQLDPVNLFMPALWEVRLNFVRADETPDQVVFRFCVDP